MVLEPGHVVDDDRPLRLARRAVRALLFLLITLPLMALTKSGRSVHVGSSASRVATAALFRVSPAWTRWNQWARARGWVRAEGPPVDPLLDERRVVMSRDATPSYRTVVGARSVPVHAASVELCGDAATHHGAYVMQVALPPEVAARFPGSSLVRRSGLGLLDSDDRGGRRLELESIRLNDDAVLRTDGGDALDWRALLDAALVDLLADGIHVEWVQRGATLLLHSPAPVGSFHVPEPARMDALAVAAVAIEHRMATIAGDGRPVAPARADWLAERAGARRQRHLRSSRRRDLAMSIEEQFAELERYTTAEEVLRVRAAIDAGRFRVDQLDDLIHHRRAAFWGASDAA